MSALHGWLVLDKPVGLGSTQAVSAVKRALREGSYLKVKVGHGGTLDPLASGVLPIALGEATKLAGRLLDSDKMYAFTITFGTETDTLDLEGREIAASDARPTLTEVETVLPRFTGAIDQVPPAFSALKVAGERAYDLARAGEELTLASRAVVIHSLQILPVHGEVPARSADGGGSATSASPAPHALDQRAAGSPSRPMADLKEVTLLAHVSKGTYIRSLARDIAHALGTVGNVTMLRRTRAGPFQLGAAISLDILGEAAKARRLEEYLLPLRAGLDDIPALSLTPDQAGALRQGRIVAGLAAHDGQYFATVDDVPVALVEAMDGDVRVVRGFNL